MSLSNITFPRKGATSKWLGSSCIEEEMTVFTFNIDTFTFTLIFWNWERNTLTTHTTSTHHTIYYHLHTCEFEEYMFHLSKCLPCCTYPIYSKHLVISFFKHFYYFFRIQFLSFLSPLLPLFFDIIISLNAKESC